MSRWIERPLLFLDVDGVLNSLAYIERGGSLSCVRDGIDPEAVKHLQRIVDETECSIILSSTWRLIHSLSDMRGKLIAKGMRYPCPLRGKTPDLSEQQSNGVIQIGVRRGEEVKHWIDSNGFKGRYVCVDDDSDFLPGQPLVKTSFSEGLTAAHADQCIAILRDDWWLIPMNCAECGKQYLRKVKAQKYCDEHRHLAGAPIRLLETDSYETVSGES